MCVGSCARVLASVERSGLKDVESSGDIPGYPVSLLQRRSIFGPADFGRWDALCRTEYGQ